MNCPHCQQHNPEQASFCMRCGTALAKSCPECGKRLPLESSACSYCGYPTSPLPAAAPAPLTAEVAAMNAALTGERRLVTVMFADISGFTAMVDSRGPEQVRGLINGCFDHVMPIVEKYGGVVDKFIGDEIMVLFGAPTAHEDDPVRALQAALEMIASLQAFNEAHQTDLGMHIGINTGLVVAGGIGSSGRQQYSVIGSGVNLAARLRSQAQRGEILLGPDTHRFAAPVFDFEPLQELAVKGKSEPVAVYKLLGIKAQPGRLRGLAGLSSPMVGRDPEIGHLVQLGEMVQSGQGRVAVIIGEPGLGKSRLISEWRAATVRQRMRDNMRWVEGRSLSYGQGLAYHLLIDLLYAMLGVPAGTSESDLRAALLALTADLLGNAAMEVFPYLGHMLSLRLEGSALDRVRLLDPQSLQAQYLVALRQILLAQAARTPLALVLEDIHWADPSSTDLLVKLLPLVRRAALLFCFVTRPIDDAPGWRMVTAARELVSDVLSELTLTHLSEEDSRQLISNLLEIEALPGQVRDLILRKAEGNPFFVEEVIRMLIEREIIVQEGTRWAARKEIESVEIPDNLQSLLLARIDRLPENVKHTLRVASIIGRQFSVRVLEEVLRTEDDPS